MAGTGESTTLNLIMERNIAVCLYGLPRKLEISKKFNSYFFRQLKLTPYFFCHTWLTTDYKFKKTYDHLEYIKNILNPTIVEQDDPVEYIKSYCTRKNLDISSNAFKDIIHAGCRPVGQFLSLERSVQLLQENKHNIPKFDIVLLIRYDVALQLEPLNLRKDKFNYDKDWNIKIHNTLDSQINDLIENINEPIIYQPLISGAINGGYPQASCYYFLTNKIGAYTFTENFGYNLISTYEQKNNPNRVPYFNDYLYDKDLNGVRNKHAYWLQQYINRVKMSLSEKIQHVVIRDACTLGDTFEEIKNKFTP